MKKSKLVWIAGIILLILNSLFYWFKFGGDTVLQYVSDLLPVVCSLIAVLSLLSAFRGFKTFDFSKAAWFLLLIGIILFLLGESTYAVLEIVYKKDMNETFPSIADVFWCAGYIPQFVCLIMMFVGYKKSGFPMGKLRNYAILTMLFVILCAGIINYLLIPIITDPESDMLTKVFSLFYPIGDLFLVAPALLLIYITQQIGSGMLSRPWKYVAAGYIFFTIADLLYSYLSWKEMYGNGNFIDLGWHAGYLLLALSALYQRELIQSLSGEADK